MTRKGVEQSHNDIRRDTLLRSARPIFQDRGGFVGILMLLEGCEDMLLGLPLQAQV